MKHGGHQLVELTEYTKSVGVTFFAMPFCGDVVLKGHGVAHALQSGIHKARISQIPQSGAHGVGRRPPLHQSRNARFREQLLGRILEVAVLAARLRRGRGGSGLGGAGGRRQLIAFLLRPHKLEPT